MPLGKIEDDGRGTISTDVFYLVETCNDPFPGLLEEREWVRTASRLAASILESANTIRAECLSEKASTDKDLLCPADPTHLRSPLLSEVGGDLYGGHVFTEFVWDVTYGRLLVGPDFVVKIGKTRLRKPAFIPYKVAVNQCDVKEPKLSLLQSSGINCARPRLVRAPNGNSCPFCKKHPVICDVCGWEYDPCLSCGKEISTASILHEGKDDPRLIRERMDPSGCVLEGRTWDGSDLVNSHYSTYMSKRMFDWCVSIHAGPLKARPARFCTDGMSDKQKAWMEEAKNLKTVDP
jgi:hypothetical protein